MGASNAGGQCRCRHKSRLSANSGLSIDDCWSANNKSDGDRAVYRTDGDASVNLCLSQPAWTTTTKITITEDCARRIEANYWQTGSIARPVCGSRDTCFRWFLSTYFALIGEVRECMFCISALKSLFGALMVIFSNTRISIYPLQALTYLL